MFIISSISFVFFLYPSFYISCSLVYTFDNVNLLYILCLLIFRRFQIFVSSFLVQIFGALIEGFPDCISGSQLGFSARFLHDLFDSLYVCLSVRVLILMLFSVV